MPDRPTETVLVPLSDKDEAEIVTLARRADEAYGGLMRLIAFAGTKVENVLESFPNGVRDAIEAVAGSALEMAYRGTTVVGQSRGSPDIGRHGHVAAAVLTGAAGGFAGLSSAIVELPVTVSIIFAAIQKAAREQGFDPNDEAVRRECLLVFGSGNPAEVSDDEASIGFITSRVLINGATVHGLIANIAPRLAAILTEKLAAQTFPVLGSIAGAGINFTFTRYYQELAEIRFALRRLAIDHGEDIVRLSFNAAATDRRRLKRG